MTRKQRDYINFIEEWSGVPYKEGENISDYINKNKDKANHEWDLECFAQNCEHESFGDRD